MDYPPLCAYLHWAISQLVVGLLGTEPLLTQGYQDWSYVALMRAVVIVLDLVVYQSAVYAMRGELKNGLQLALAMNIPCMIIVDHGHFQFNSVMHGLVLWAVVMITRGHLVRATIFMVLAVMFKQMALYFALPFGVYALC